MAVTPHCALDLPFQNPQPQKMQHGLKIIQSKSPKICLYSLVTAVADWRKDVIFGPVTVLVQSKAMSDSEETI